MSKTKVQEGDDAAYGSQVLEELKEQLREYLCFVSTDFVVCDVCGMKVSVRRFPEHIENEHYDPPQRVWSKRRWVSRRRPWEGLMK
jgi:hypothetical protein